jgi:hypothetical protein
LSLREVWEPVFGLDAGIIIERIRARRTKQSLSRKKGAVTNCQATR